MELERETRLYSEIAKEYFDSLQNFGEIYNIINRCSKGRIYIIGGRLVRVISNQVHGLDLPLGDLDVMTEKKRYVDNLFVQGWNLQDTHFGDFRYVKEDGLEVVDIMRLTNYHPAIRMDIEPKMKDFFRGVPLNVHGIAYELRTGKLRGDAAIEGIAKRLVWINNPEETERAAHRLGITVKEFVQKKADDLGFNVAGSSNFYSYNELRKA